MKRKKPLVSIILPTQNSSKFLRDCLQSVSSQSERQIEIIAIDDLSKDNSFKILSQYKKREKRLKIYKNKKRYGLSVTLNRAVKKAKGKFITFLNPEDTITKTRIKKQINFLISNPKVVGVGTQCIFIDNKNRKIGKSELPTEHQAIYQALVPGLSMEFETMMINREALPKDILKFDSNSKPFIYTDLLMKLTQYGELANLKQCLQFHKKDIENKSLNLDQMASFIKLWVKSVNIYIEQHEFHLVDFLMVLIRMLRFTFKINVNR